MIATQLKAWSQIILNVVFLKYLHNFGVIEHFYVPKQLIRIPYALKSAVDVINLSSILLGIPHENYRSLGSDSVHYKGRHDDYEY